MTIFGLDFSHYDAVPSGARVISEGFSFMTHKAGGDKDDAEVAGWWNALKPYRDRVLLGAYWVLYPGRPTARAQAFLDRLDSQCPGWRSGPFILQLDCEDWTGDGSTKPGLADIRAACIYLEGETGFRPIVYASKGQYGNSLAGLGYPLWNARYPTSQTGAASGIYAHAGGDSGAGWGSYSGQTPAIWQFSSSVTALGQTTCDANAYRGSLAQLTALVAPGWSNDVELTDKYGDEAWTGRTIADRYKDDAKLRDVLWGDAPGTKAAGLPAGSPLAKLIAVPDRLARLEAALTALTAGEAGQTKDIISGVLAGLPAADIAAAIPAGIAADVADELARRLDS